MELLEEELTCPICCCLFEDPRVLPCSHSFCKKCLEGILDGNRSAQWRPPFKCPTCRKETQHGGINSMQVNYTLRGIVEKYNKIRTLPRMAICKEHSGQPLNIFCSTDLKLICGFCATTGEHKGHKLCALEDAYEQEKRACVDLLQGVESWSGAETMSCLETLEGSKKKALQLLSRDADQVKEYFEKLISALDQKKSEILSDFETLRLVVMQAYDPEINKLSAVLEEQRRALNIAESFRHVTDPLRFLQQMHELREKLKFVRGTTLPSRTDMDVGPLVQNFDVKNWDSVKFKDVDKLSVPHETGFYSSVTHETGFYCSKSARASGRSWGKVALILCLILLTSQVFLHADNFDVSLYRSMVSPLWSLLSHACCDATPLLSDLMDTCQKGYLYLINTAADILTCML